MSEELIDRYVDRSGIADDTKFLTDQLKTVLDLFEKVNTTKIKLNVATGLKETTEAAKETQKAMDNLKTGKEKLITVDIEAIRTIKEQVKSMKDLSAGHQELVTQSVKNEIAGKALRDARAHLNAAYKEERITLEQLQEGLEEIKVAEVELKLSNEQLSRALKNLEKDSQGAEGSLDKLRAQLNLSLQAFDALSAEEKKSATGADLTKKIQDLTKAISDEEQATGRFQRNVGNYPGSAKIIVDALERAREKFTTLSKAVDTTPAALQRARGEFEALRGITDDRQFLSFAAGAGDATKEVRTFTRTLVNLEAQGLGSSEVANELRARLAELTDQVGDTRDAIKAMASDTHAFDQFAGAVTFAADTFQVASSAAIAFGASEEDAAQATQTLVAIQNISNGIKGIANELTTKGTFANKIFAFSQKQVAVAMDSTAASSVRLRAALITLGIGALIIGIGLLVANFSKLKDALSGLSTTQKAINDINKKAIEGYVQERIHVEAVVKQVQNENTSKERKKEIIKELNNLSPAYFSNIKSEKDIQDKLNESVIKYVKAIELKARARAAEDALVESEKAIVLRQIELQRQLEAAKTQTFDTEERKQRHINGLKKLIDDGADAELQALQNKAAPIKKVMADINAELDALGGDPGKAIQLPFAATKKAYTDELQSQSEAFKKLSENEDAYLITRLSARNKALELQKRILNRQKAVEIENLNAQIAVEAAKGIIDENTQKGFNQTRLDIKNDYAEKGRSLERAYGEDIINIRQTFIAKQREQEEKDNADFLKDQEDRLNAAVESIQQEQERRLKNNTEGQQAEIDGLNKWYEERVAATREGSKKRLKVEEKYAQERAEIEYRYAIAAVKNEIDAAEKILAVHKIAGINVAAEEKAIHDLKIKLSDAERDHVISNEHKKAKTRQDKLQDLEAGISKALEIEGKVAGIVGGLISANVDKQKNAIQGQIDDLDKKKEKEIEVVNASALSEQEKADKIAVINARAAVQKEALERKQLQLDLQRARFEKIANIARIGLETALAVVHQLGSGDPYTAIPRAIAVGALGAAELAVAIATPLPKFKHGREGGRATWGVTGDGGVHEVVSSPDLKQSFVTPATDTLTYLPEGWKVFPNVKEFQDTAVNMVHKPLRTMPVTNNNNDGLIRAMAYEIGGLKRAIMGKQETHFYWEDGQLKKAIQNGNDWTRYVQNNF